MNPPTVEEIKAAYETIGLKPITDWFYVGGSCCPLSAIAIARTEDLGLRCQLTRFLEDSSAEKLLVTRKLAPILGAPSVALAAFTEGFDGVENNGGDEAWYWAGVEAKRYFFL